MKWLWWNQTASPALCPVHATSWVFFFAWEKVQPWHSRGGSNEASRTALPPPGPWVQWTVNAWVTLREFQGLLVVITTFTSIRHAHGGFLLKSVVPKPQQLLPDLYFFNWCEHDNVTNAIFVHSDASCCYKTHSIQKLMKLSLHSYDGLIQSQEDAVHRAQKVLFICDSG